MDNRPVKANKFGGRGGRFSAASRLQQQRAVREAGAKGQPEEKKGGKMSLQAQRKQPWQNYGRENQRVRGAFTISGVVTSHRGNQLTALQPSGSQHYRFLTDPLMGCYHTQLLKPQCCYGYHASSPCTPVSGNSSFLQAKKRAWGRVQCAVSRQQAFEHPASCSASAPHILRASSGPTQFYMWLALEITSSE